MVEVIGCVPKLSSTLLSNLDWLRDLLNVTKEEIREIASLLYAIVVNNLLAEKDFDNVLQFLINQTVNKSLEMQHGAIFGLANVIERKIMSQKLVCTDFSKWELFKSSINTIGEFVILYLSCITRFVLVPFLTHQNTMLISAATVAIGQLGKSTSLPLETGKAPKNGSPDAKRPANNKITKFSIFNQLLQNMKSAKLQSKAKERSAKSLGLLCIGEDFPFTKEVIQGFLDTAKEVR